MTASEDSSIRVWQTVVKEVDLPTVTAQPGLDAGYLFEYLHDGKDEKEGVSLSLTKEGVSEIIFQVTENRSSRRPPTFFCFHLDEFGKEDKIVLLERAYVAMKKEIRDLKEALAQPQCYSLDGWTLSMSSKIEGASNTKEALLDRDVYRGAGTLCDQNQWIQATFPFAVEIKGVLLASPQGMPGGWSASHVNNRQFQYSNDGIVWSKLFTVSGVDDYVNRVRYFGYGVTARYYRLYCEGDSNVGTCMLKFF
eukprot:CAMPEP_0201524250 /NCGR_PEP_ID=MMETSP0161_2-20130828/21199_1 /ASSEMBLY_ACC=CAM_ASM_000251 /TAXON_ID=180227 /ORGANISM="Neoparamoeba aestuarina, Strain SoJaBio B1-5/56/2" /LENGTH=250 /DNA_ID=CAMNT_0047923549 /DNA_START=173 /DNA_END=925 /DNA_ORIENTATION=+